MKTLLPLDELSELFPTGLASEVIADVQSVVSREPDAMRAAALNVWNRIVFGRLMPVEPRALAKAVDNGDPFLYRHIEAIIKEPVFREVIFLRSTVDLGSGPTFAGQYIAAVVFPGDIQLVDIAFNDPRRPIPQHQRRYRLQTHKGLQLLPVVVARALTYAREHELGHLTLTASALDLVPLFRRHGFEVEDNAAGILGMKSGSGIPMERRC